MKPLKLPPSAADLQQRLLRRVLHLSFWSVFVLLAAYGVIYFLRGQRILALVEVGSGALMAVGYAIGIRRHRPLLGLQFNAVISWMLLAVLIAMQGGLRSPALAWILMLAPLMMLAGDRLALVMTAATVLLVAGLYGAEVSGRLPPFGDVPLVQRALSAALIAILFAVFAWYALRWRVRLAEELAAARDAAIEANHLKDRFIANLNHEIRTPMNALVAGARLLGRQQRMGDEEQSLVQAMQRSADHLLSLVNDVLDYARLEAGAVDMDPIEFSLAELTGSAVEMFTPLATSKKIGLRLDLPPGLPDAWVGEPTRLRQVLTNLLSNAVKFTPAHGKVTLRVAHAAGAQGGSVLRFEVSDTGPGMSPQTLARIFRPYEQGDASITRRYGGTGLGLSICKELLRLMHGSIDVASQPGVGSTFRVSVPLVPVDRSVKRPAPSPHAAGGELPAGLKILLVEDDAVNRMVTEAVLRDIGAQVLTAESGARALELMEQADVDLVLMDCQMPDMDGMTATRRWRSREDRAQRPRVPVIALTGEATAGARAACLDAGMNDYLTKPTSERDLVAMLTRWAPARSAHADLGRPALAQRAVG